MAARAALDPRTPVIVGAGQVVQRPGEQETRDPIGLAVEALRRAGADSGAGEKLLLRARLWRFDTRWRRVIPHGTPVWLPRIQRLANTA